MRKDAGTPALTPAEWKVMDCVWTRGEATVREVHGDLLEATGWASTTVKTMLERLAAKGVVRGQCEQQGSAVAYVPRITRGDAQRDEAQALLERAFGGQLAPLVKLLDEIASTR